MAMLAYFVLVSIFSLISASVVENDYSKVLEQRMHPHSRQTTVGPSTELDQSFWIIGAMKTLEDQLAKTDQKRNAKNVIFFIGDGMSLATIAAARTLMGQQAGRVGENEKLSFEKFPVIGLSHTYCVNAQVADSACSATAYLGGVKANDGTIGVAAAVPFEDCNAMNNETHFVKSLAHQAMDAGKSAGVVTTTRVTHASPAGAYAHTSCRNWESDADIVDSGKDPKVCKDIAYQLVMSSPGKDLQVILGGGLDNFVPEEEKGRRLDGINLVNKWKENKQNRSLSHQYVVNKAELLAAAKDKDYILGLFQKSHMDYHLLADNAQQPTLEEMTEAAISVLSKNSKGYFLFIEGGRIDHAHHDTMAHLALDETIEMSKAVEKALKLTSTEDTLIVVSSDHSHTMTISGYPSRGNDILGTADIYTADDGLNYTTISYANGPGYRPETVNNLNQTQTDRVDVSKEKDFIERKPEVKYPGMVPLKSETHGGEDVAVFAYGPWQHLFTGSYEQNVIPHLIAYASCYDKEKYKCNSAGSLSAFSVVMIASIVSLLRVFQ